MRLNDQQGRKEKNGPYPGLERQDAHGEDDGDKYLLLLIFKLERLIFLCFMFCFSSPVSVSHRDSITTRQEGGNIYFTTLISTQRVAFTRPL